MHIFCQSFHTQKQGNTCDEYEDAFAPDQQVDKLLSLFRVAVTDGATDSSFSHLWASLLARSYFDGKLFDRSAHLRPRTLRRLQEEWNRGVTKRPLPWYAEAKLQMGTFAALLGLTISDTEGRPGPAQWSAVAIGDTSLFHVRGDSLLTGFPLKTAAEYTSRPVLISSTPSANRDLAHHMVRTGGNCLSDDRFYLMTDALAHWFLSSNEADEHPWRILADLDTQQQPASFCEWTSSLRAAGKLRNDDVTLLRIDLG